MTDSDTVWSQPPDQMVLRDRDVHVWRAMLDQHEPRLATFWQIMAEDERQRAERLVFLRDRNHFIAARGLLRMILSGYCGRAPEWLQFQYGQHGKPALKIESGSTALSFNLAHSHGVALYAITRERRIGVDIEHIRDMVGFATIAKAHFSADEYATLCELPAAAQLEAFFTCWVRKEAYIKARGEGLAYPLNQFEVSLRPGDAPELLRNTSDPTEVERWRLYDCVPGPGYLGAIAVEGHSDHVLYWQIDP